MPSWLIGENIERASANRFNVAVSRAECLAVVVHGTELLDCSWTKIEDLRRLNLFAHAEAIALHGEPMKDIK